MDKIRQVAGKLGQTKDDAETVLKRNHKSIPLIHRSRDVIGVDEDFSMEFTVPTLPAVINLNLFFMPAGIICNEQTGCFTGRCDFFTGSTSTVLTTVYEYVPGVIYAYNNDASVTFTETGANEITLDSAPLAADHITLCYVYQTCEYPECVTGYNDVFVDDFDRNEASWGVTSLNLLWDWEEHVSVDEDYAPAEYTMYTDGDRGHVEIEAVNPITQIFPQVDVATGVGGRLSGKDWVEVYWDVEYHTAGTYLINGYYGYLVPIFEGGNDRYMQWQFAPLSGTFTWLNRTLGLFTSFSGYNYGINEKFYVAHRLETTGNQYFKSWSATEPEPDWILAPTTMLPAQFDPSEINWFGFEGRSSDGSNPGGTPGASSGTTHFSIGFIKLRYCQDIEVT